MKTTTHYTDESNPGPMQCGRCGGAIEPDICLNGKPMRQCGKESGEYTFHCEYAIQDWAFR